MSVIIPPPGSGSAGPVTDWVPVLTGFSANPTNTVYRYQQNGKIVILFIRQGTVGTSNATTFTISLPFVAATIANMSWFSYGSGVDNGGTLASPMLMRVNSGATVLSLFTTPSSGGWTASGAKAATGTIIYEAA